MLVVADDLSADSLGMALEAADYHDAATVVVAPAGSIDPEELGDAVTLLERPLAEDGEAGVNEVGAARDDAAFAAFIADYALRLDGGDAPATAFAAALGDSAWEPSADE